MFWENLSGGEQTEYAILLKKTSKWIAWISTEPKKRTEPEPPIPSDQEWIEMDRIAFKGWSS